MGNVDDRGKNTHSARWGIARVLVIDDDGDFAESIGDIFLQRGYSVELASDEPRALKIATDFFPDIALIDVRLGAATGLNLITPLKEICPDIACIMMTGYAAPETILESMRLKAYDYLSKPVDVDLLMSTIDRCLNVVNLKQEKQAAVVALQKSEQQYRRLVESLRDEYFFYSYDVEGEFTYVSPSLSNVLGHQPAEFMLFGEHFVDSELNAAAKKSVEKSLQGSSSRYEVEVMAGDGSLHRLEVNESAVLNDGGEVVGVDGIAHDITERLAAQERFKRLASATHEAIVVFDDHGIIEANQVFSTLFAVELDVVVGLDALLFVVRDSHDSLQEHLRLMDGSPCEIVARSSDGKEFPAQIRSQWISHGGKKARVSAIRDLTGIKKGEAERLRMREQLRQSQKMEALGQLTGGIAHDFNNMLQCILGYAGIVAMRLESGDIAGIEAYVDRIRETTEQGNELISQMLTYSRGGKTQPEVLDLRKVVPQAVEFFRASLVSSAELQEDFAEEVPPVLMSRVQLQQIFLNLCINARDAMENREGTIRISLSTLDIAGDYCSSCGLGLSGQFVQLSVEDDGHGFDDAAMTKMFDPFFTTKEVGKGTGMGLAMVHGMLHEHGGHIVAQPAESGGAVFRILLPVHTETAESSDAAQSAAPKKKASPSNNILVVDDSEDLALFLEELLRSGGYRTTVKTDPRQALEVFEQDPSAFDLVITDQVMPGLSGDKLVESLLGARADLPIIMCTGYSRVVDEEQAAQLNIQGFIRKPFTAEKMLALVKQIIEAPVTPI